MNNKKGFTLTELIVVIVIIGIISLITIPNIMKALQKSREQNGEAVEKMLVHNLELYNTDYKEDLWCLDKCEPKDPDHEDGSNEDGDIVTTQNIGISDLMNMNPDIDMGDCLLQDADSLQITKVETITNQGTENEKRDYKYSFSARIICSTDYDSKNDDDKILDVGTSEKNVYYKTPTPGENIETYNYTINYYSYDGTVPYGSSEHTSGVEKKLTLKSELSNVTAPTEKTFQGWATEKNKTTTIYTDGQSVKNLAAANGEEVNLYAVWKKDGETLIATPKPNEGGGTTEKVSCEIAAAYNGETQATSCEITLPASNYNREGYTFNGWVISENEPTTTLTNGRPAGQKIQISKEIYLIATWKSNEKTYTVEYYSYDGSTKYGSSSHIYGTTKNLTTINNLGATAPGGKSFVGWATSANNTTKTYDNGQSVSNLTSTDNGVIKLYAIWNKKTTATFYYYNGTSQTSTTNSCTVYNAATSCNIAVPTAVSNSNGGNLAGTYNGVASLAGSASTVTPTNANTKYYAVYSESVTFYYYNGSSHTNASRTRRMLSNGSSYSASWNSAVPSPSTYSGASFSSWSTSSTAIVESTPLSNAAQTFYATYGKTLNITYEGNVPKTELSSERVNTFDGYVLGDFDIESSWTFYGGSTQGTLSDNGYDENTDVYDMLSSMGSFGLTDGTNYVAFEESKYDFFTVTKGKMTGISNMPSKQNFSINYISKSGGITTINNSITISSKTPTTTEYIFANWNTSSSGTGTTYVQGTTYTNVTSNLTLYAQWTKNQSTVTYNFSENGGTSATKTTASVSAGANVDLTPTATKSGWTFVGWNTNKAATTALSTLTMETSDITLYAIYSKTSNAKFYYYNGATTVSANNSCTMYNKTTSCSISIPDVVKNSKLESYGATYQGVSNDINSTETVIPSSTNTNTDYYAVYGNSATFYYYDGSSNTSKVINKYYAYDGTEYTASSDHSIPSPSSYNGASFSAWSTSSTTVVEANPLTSQDKAFYATYSKSISINFDDNKKTIQSSGPSTTQTIMIRQVTLSDFGIDASAEYRDELGNEGIVEDFAFADTDTIADIFLNYEISLFEVTQDGKIYTFIYNDRGTGELTIIDGEESESVTINNMPQNQSATVKYISKAEGITTKGASVTLNSTAPTANGYIFNEWNTNSNASGTSYTKGGTYEFTSSTTLYAIWTSTTATISIVANNGIIEGLPIKNIQKGSMTLFELKTTTENTKGIVECTNNQTATLNGNILKTGEITEDTVCTVTYTNEATTLYDDGTLIINEKIENRKENIEKHGEVLKEYTAMKDTNSYYLLSPKEQPWYKERSEINSITLGQEIKPASTAYWFAYLENLSYGDFTKLNTTEVENMSYMFLRSGVNKESFELKGLDNWNTSNVKYMDYMFYQTADIVNWMLDLSNWIVTNVISHNHFNDLEKITEPKWNN